MPGLNHDKIDFTHCENKEELLPLATEALYRLPEPVSVVAWSLGAFVALALLREASHKVHSLYLTGVGSQFVRTDEYPYGWDHRVLTRMKRQLEVNTSDVIRQFDENMFFPSQHDDTWQDLRKTIPSIPTLQAGLDYLLDFKMDPSLQQIKTAIFLLTGDIDQITPIEGATHLHQSLSPSRLTIWKEIGHIPFWTHPYSFHDWIRNPK
jgi:pimeloyl-[acyl-carrier protein] methyl ester esterase